MDNKAIIKALRDTAQSASNTVAEGVSVPIDLIAAILRKAGVQVPPNAMGGEQWMKENGLVKDVPEGYPKAIGQFGGMVVPAVALGKIQIGKR